MRKDQKQQEIDRILQQVEEHKKAILYSFFDSFQNLNVSNLELETFEEERTRAIVTFEEEKKVIYEKGSLEMEQGFRKYISWFNHNILKDKKMYCKNMISYMDCGFIESPEEKWSSGEEQKKNYYYRLGSMIALLSALNVELVDAEDVVEVDEQPVIKDIRRLIKARPMYNRNEKAGRKMFGELEERCPVRYRSHMKEGYEDVFSFMCENEKDMKEIVKLCFSE